MAGNDETDLDGADGGADFFDKVRDAIADLVEVKVVTIVGDVTVTVESTGKSTETTIEKSQITGDSLVTVVKLVDGDVTTVAAEGLLDNPHVRAMHSDQVANSLQVIPQYLKTLVEIYKDLTSS